MIDEFVPPKKRNTAKDGMVTNVRFSAARIVHFQNLLAPESIPPIDVEAKLGTELTGVLQREGLGRQSVMIARLNPDEFPDRNDSDWLLVTGPTYDTYEKKVDDLPDEGMHPDAFNGGLFALIKGLIAEAETHEPLIVGFRLLTKQGSPMNSGRGFPKGQPRTLAKRLGIKTVRPEDPQFSFFGLPSIVRDLAKDN